MPECDVDAEVSCGVPKNDGHDDWLRLGPASRRGTLVGVHERGRGAPFGKGRLAPLWLCGTVSLKKEAMDR